MLGHFGGRVGDRDNYLKLKSHAKPMGQKEGPLILSNDGGGGDLEAHLSLGQETKIRKKQAQQHGPAEGRLLCVWHHASKYQFGNHTQQSWKRL